MWKRWSGCLREKGKAIGLLRLLLPPESPFVFWSIAGLAYLGLVDALVLIGPGIGKLLIRAYRWNLCCSAAVEFLTEASSCRRGKMKTDFKVSGLWKL